VRRLVKLKGYNVVLMFSDELKLLLDGKLAKRIDSPRQPWIDQMVLYTL
jgi:hypothetical protein